MSNYMHAPEYWFITTYLKTVQSDVLQLLNLVYISDDDARVQELASREETCLGTLLSPAPGDFDFVPHLVHLLNNEQGTNLQKELKLLNIQLTRISQPSLPLAADSDVGIGCIATGALAFMMTGNVDGPPLRALLSQINSQPFDRRGSIILSSEPMEQIEKAISDVKDQWAIYWLGIRWASPTGEHLMTHVVSIVQTPNAYFRILQSYGGVYSLSSWLSGRVKSPFNKWLDLHGIKAFWARAIASGFKQLCSLFQIVLSIRIRSPFS